MHCPTNCVTCEDSSEDLIHVFLDCSFAMQVWHRSGMGDVIPNVRTRITTAAEAIFTIFHDITHKNYQCFAALMCSLQKHKNLKLC